MAAYTSQTRLAAYLGSEVLTEVLSTTGVDLDVLIADMSDLVATRLRNSGYTPPDVDDPDLVADKTVCLATEAVVIRALCEVRDANLPLPDGWSDSAQELALEGILSGAAQLNLPRSTASSVGGWLASNRTSSVADGGRPQRSSRRELAGF